MAVYTSCGGVILCGNAARLDDHGGGPVVAGWEFIDGEWWCPCCVIERWTPLALATGPLACGFTGLFLPECHCPPCCERLARLAQGGAA